MVQYLLSDIVKLAIFVSVQKHTIDNRLISSIYSSIYSMQNFITLVLSGVVKKYYGIKLLLSFHHSRLVAEFRDQYYNNSCLVQGSQ